MNLNVNPEDILFLDIETVPLVSDYESMSDTMQLLWERKSRSWRSDIESPADVYDRAGLYAEFGKVICISVGHITGTIFRIKSVYGDDEALLLQEFGAVLSRWEARKEPLLCGHNSKDFDLPYIARRMIIQGVKVPDILNSAGKKPWEIKHLDTMELWRFGDYRYNSSLALLAEVMGIPTPKDDIDGSMVASVYYDDKDLNRIVTYCEKDVVTVARLFLRFTGRTVFDDTSVESLTLF